MNALTWFQIVTAVLAANGLSLWFAYGAWTVSKIEKNGGKPEQAPWSALFALAVPPILGALGAYMLTT